MKYLGLVIKVLVLAAAGYWLIETHAGVLSLLGIMFGAISTLVGGWRIGVAASLSFGLVTALAIEVNHHVIIATIFVTLVAFAVAWSSRFGLYGAWVPALIIAAIVTSADSEKLVAHGNAWLAGLFVTGGSLVAVAAWQIPPVIPTATRLARLTEPGALIFAGIVSGITLVMTWVILHFDLPHGYWMIGAFAACVQPQIGRSESRAIRRQVGTVLGVFVGLVIAQFVHQDAVLWTIAVIFLLATVAAMSQGYEVSVGLVAAAIVLMAATVGTADEVAVNRLILNIVGAATVIVIVIVLTPILVRIDKRVPLCERSQPLTT